MPTYNVYIGNANGSNLWGVGSGFRTAFGTTPGCTFSTYNATGPDDGKVLTLPADEYPTAIQYVSGGELVSGATAVDEDAYIYLCDTTGSVSYRLAEYDFGQAHSMSDLSHPKTGETLDWKALAGKTLAISKAPVPGRQSEGGISQSDWQVRWHMQAVFQITTLKHEIIWTNPSLSFSQNEYVLTVTKGGSATDSWQEAVTYRLQMDGTDLGAFSGNSMDITLTDSQLETAHTFDLVAVSSISSIGCTESHTPHSVHKTMKYRQNGEWVECYANVRDGSTWVEVEPFYYDGTSWVPCSQT